MRRDSEVNVPDVCILIREVQHLMLHTDFVFSFDEVMSALSVAFNLSGTRIYSGFNHAVKIFNTEVPGRDCDTISIKGIYCFSVN